MSLFADDAFGEHQISLQQRLGGALHGLTGQAAHFGDGGSQAARGVV